jgi:hypothetical protein
LFVVAETTSHSDRTELALTVVYGIFVGYFVGRFFYSKTLTSAALDQITKSRLFGNYFRKTVKSDAGYAWSPLELLLPVVILYKPYPISHKYVLQLN